jgi:hypothetical protein
LSDTSPSADALTTCPSALPNCASIRCAAEVDSWQRTVGEAACGGASVKCHSVSFVGRWWGGAKIRFFFQISKNLKIKIFFRKSKIFLKKVEMNLFSSEIPYKFLTDCFLAKSMRILAKKSLFSDQPLRVFS